MKRFFNYLVILFVFFGSSVLYAGSGPLFKVTDTGNPGKVVVALCLNGKGPLSCQKYTTKALTLSITTVIAKHNYPNAGIQIITPGYTLSGCTPYSNGYCLFSVNDTTPRAITLHQTNHYTLGGTVSGLVGSVTLKNMINGEQLPLKSDGRFTFPNTLANGAPYQVIIANQPAQPFHCTLSQGKGVVHNSNVTDIKVVCSEQTGVLSGNVVGLTSGQRVVIQNNDIDPKSIAGPSAPPPGTPFSFPAQAVGSEYVVTVKTQPAAQTCSVSHGTGVMVNGGVSGVKVACSTNTYSVGGTITGLAAGQTVVLQNNGTDPLSRSSKGSFTFTTKIANGSDYEVTIKTQPKNQTCTVSNGNGTIGGANVTDVEVSCVADTTTLSLNKSSVVVPVNQINTVTVTNTGAFAARNVIAKLPAGWTNVSATPGPTCANLAPNQSCIITFNSQANQPYVAQGGIQITGDNTPTPPTMAIAFSYQSYLVMSVDTSSTMTVVYNSDVVSFEPPGWDTSNNCQYGSCSTTGATSLVNGAYLNTAGNTYKIINTLGTQSQPANMYNAAGFCYNIASDNTGSIPNGTWYLPTICQLGGSGQGASCPSGISNINANLYQLGFGGFTSSGSSGYSFKSYWSSNENTSNVNQAWMQNFNMGTSNQLLYYKTFNGRVRCVRSITY